MKIVREGFRVGFVGLGKLGLPCAAAISSRLNQPVVGFDKNPLVAEFVRDGTVPYLEEDIEEYLARSDVRVLDSVEEVVDRSDIIFVAVQTPHEPQFEGVTPTPNETADFSYEYLVQAIDELVLALEDRPAKKLTVTVISTVLPGTMRRLVLPRLASLGDRVGFVYNPFFIAMGTTIRDFLSPEFVLLGSNSESATATMRDLYSEIHSKECVEMRVESAELTKVAYNTFIGFKIVFANTLGQITEVRGGDVDEVTSALAKASDRLMSAKYLSAGMGDGGGCHPRDQIAMSSLAQQVGATDIFGWLARARDEQTLAQARLVKEIASSYGLPVVVMGLAYKADVNLLVGSPALLLCHYLKELGVDFTTFDPHVNEKDKLPEVTSVFFVATNHKIFKNISIPRNSIVIDPWGDSLGDTEGLEIFTPGRKPGEPNAGS